MLNDLICYSTLFNFYPTMLLKMKYTYLIPLDNVHVSLFLFPNFKNWRLNFAEFDMNVYKIRSCLISGLID
jgi:hypothetical protein